MESEWYGVISFVQGSRVGWGRKQFFIYDGDGISEWYEIIIVSRESREYIRIY